MRYPEIFPPEDPSFHPTVASRTMFVHSVDRGAAAAIIDALARCDAPMRVVQLRVLGGAMARVPADATAFAHRSSRIMAGIVAFYSSADETPAREQWVTSLAASLHQGDTGAYVNFMGDEGPARVRHAYPGATWDRLAAVKARYDPANVFHLNQNVQPG